MFHIVFNCEPVFMRYCGCRNLSSLFSSCSMNTLDELICCGIRGIGTLRHATMPRSGMAFEQVHNGLKKHCGYRTGSSCIRAMDAHIISSRVITNITYATFTKVKSFCKFDYACISDAFALKANV